MNFINVASVTSRIGSLDKLHPQGRVALKPKTTDDWDFAQDEVTLDDFLERQPDLKALSISHDLPNQLSLLDVESLMPKLSVLPDAPGGNQRLLNSSPSDSFSSQVSIDAIFHSHSHDDSNAVDVLLRCFAHGPVSITIYGTIDIGLVKPPEQWSLKHCTTILSASHPYSCSHSLLMEIPGQNASGSSVQSRQRVVLVPLTLRSIHSARSYLYLIASKTTQLQNLVKYVNQTCECVIAFWRHAQELPSKFMRNAEEALSEGEEPGLVESLYHLAVTGDCPPPMRDWLADQLTENVRSLYNNVC